MNCYDHFIQDDDLTKKILNDYKVSLNLIRGLPECLINKIVDEYVDARIKCVSCDYKFSSLNEDISDGYANVCYGCNKWVCDICVTTEYSLYKIDKFCKVCCHNFYNEYEDSDSSFSST
jgi:hypothetical protein